MRRTDSFLPPRQPLFLNWACRLWYGIFPLAAWLSLWPCSLPAPAHVLISWIGETWIATTENSSVISILLILNPKQQLLRGKLTLSQPTPGPLASVQCCSMILLHFGALWIWGVAAASSILLLPRCTEQRKVRRYLSFHQSCKKKRGDTSTVPKYFPFLPCIIRKFLFAPLEPLPVAHLCLSAVGSEVVKVVGRSVGGFHWQEL